MPSPCHAVLYCFVLFSHSDEHHYTYTTVIPTAASNNSNNDDDAVDGDSKIVTLLITLSLHAYFLTPKLSVRIRNPGHVQIIIIGPVAVLLSLVSSLACACCLPAFNMSPRELFTGCVSGWGNVVMMLPALPFVMVGIVAMSV